MLNRLTVKDGSSEVFEMPNGAHSAQPVLADVQQAGERLSVVATGKEKSRHAMGAIPPKGCLEIFFSAVPPGSYVLSIEHSDEIVHLHEKCLVGQVLIEGQSLTAEACASTGLSFSAQYGGYLYLGGGNVASGRIRRERGLVIGQKLQNLALRVHSTLPRYVNIDHVKLFPEGRNYPESAPGAIYSQIQSGNHQALIQLENEVTELRAQVALLRDLVSSNLSSASRGKGQRKPSM